MVFAPPFAVEDALDVPAANRQTDFGSLSRPYTYCRHLAVACGAGRGTGPVLGGGARRSLGPDVSHCATNPLRRVQIGPRLPGTSLRGCLRSHLSALP